MAKGNRPVGVIGTGLMGTACAKRLLAAGFEVLGYDADPAKLKAFEALAGSGGRAKLAINLILGINRAGLAEGLVFAQRMGLDPAAFLPVARNSAAYSQAMDIKGKKMVAGEFSPQGYVHQSLKDFSLMLEQARRLKQRLPLGETYKALMEGCVASGESELDNSAVIREIRRRAG